MAIHARFDREWKGLTGDGVRKIERGLFPSGVVVTQIGNELEITAVFRTVLPEELDKLVPN